MIRTENPAVIFWKLYYGDDTVFSSDDGDWDVAPDDDVQVLVLWRADGMTRTLQGADYYWYDLDAPLETFGRTNDEEDAGASGRNVKTGKWVTDEVFMTLLLKAQNDAQFYVPNEASE